MTRSATWAEPTGWTEPAVEPAARTITLGVMVDDPSQERWVLNAVRRSLLVPGVRLAAVVVLDGASGRAAMPRFSVTRQLHRSFDRIDRQLRCIDESLFGRLNIMAELALPPLRLRATPGRGGWTLDEAARSALSHKGVDIWLCFTGAPPRRPLEGVSSLGVWGIEIGAGVTANSAWSGAMEVARRSPVTTVSIIDYACAEGAANGGGVRYRSFGKTQTNSVRLNRRDCLNKGIGLFPRLLARVTANREPWQAPAMPPRYPVEPRPTLLALGQLSWRLLANIARNRMFKMRWREQWQIAYRISERAQPDRLERLRSLVPPPDRFWADPFAVEHQGRMFIFFEELPYATERGRLMAVEVFENAEPSEPRPILERPHHLSYPFVFHWQDALYMIPEGAESGRIELYRCTEFPWRWDLHQVLMEGVSAYDTTLWQAEDRWWMFVNIAEPGAASSDELHLFWSDTPFGPWHPHAQNPVLSDVRRARPAGPLFMRDGVLYRPSQDCSFAYGHSVWLNRVDVLTPERYAETPLRRLAPEWSSQALRMHTIGAGRRLQVLDYLVNRKQR